MKDGFFKMEWLIELIQKQESERTDWIEQLKATEPQHRVKQAYISFIKFTSDDFDENIELSHSTEGTIVLDVLKDGRIGGIEFLKYVPHY
ncbi:hypothetical protein M0G43_10125 [Subsaxibacter sp. CAU 1640]|uniref:hypothetical protein n=1 Tax=Subsaxibacter sp. CAU 1640 TaxID=2933271 RepID=UPI002004E490|nr:hypothetical protein [Subsaxibacter sp. CAU 1640]MCK7590928.1 hypothetical protein [Subsaxibacter sp. CAU 1640]